MEPETSPETLPIKKQYKEQTPKYKGRGALPKGLQNKIAFHPNGNPRSEKAVAWFYRYMDCTDASQAAKDAGYAEKSAAVTGWQLLTEFAPLVREAVMYQGAMIAPLALKTIKNVLLAYDPAATVEVEKTMRDGAVERTTISDPAKAGPQAAVAALKATEILFDRWGYPKTMVMEYDGKGEESEDFREHLNQIADRVGAVMLLQMPFVKDRKEFRDYAEVLVAAEAARSVIDVTPGSNGEGG